MKTIRRQRLNELLNGTRFNGDRATFLKASNLSKGRLTQLLKPTESFGDAAARNLCESLGLPDGWFDLIPNQATSTAITNHSAINSGASLLDGLRVLAECLEGMEQSDRKAAIAMLWRLETEPQSYAKVAAQIEVMRGTAFTPQLRKQA